MEDKGLTREMHWTVPYEAVLSPDLIPLPAAPLHGDTIKQVTQKLRQPKDACYSPRGHVCPELYCNKCSRNKTFHPVFQCFMVHGGFIYFLGLNFKGDVAKNI